MGYRSDVAYKMWFDNIEVRNAYIDMVLARTEPLLEEALGECDIAVGQPYITFEVQSVKWYDGFDDVESHLRLLRLGEEWFPDSYGALLRRIGEDLDDIETDEFGTHALLEHDEIEVRRSLELYNPYDSMSLAKYKEQV